mmetsp:Transcript_24028/g.58357  ORF Transcript_24028/g.58357 Transcript_24028/m.58357 type:complete len:513 (+) Transcript_24028:33-1571(+)
MSDAVKTIGRHFAAEAFKEGRHLWSKHFQKKPTSWIRSLIRSPWELPVAALNLAAVAIQRAMRRRLAERVDSGEAEIETFSKAKPPTAPGRVRESLRNRYLKLMQSQLENRFSLDGRQKFVGTAYRGFDHFCAALVQGFWRARKAHNINVLKRIIKMKTITVAHIAAIEIQRSFRDFIARVGAKPVVETSSRGSATPTRRAPEKSKDQDSAASRIQRAFRATSDYRMYKALRDLIAFHNRGNPYSLLRAVCPIEAQVLEPAMRGHVRYRLGGSAFPPAIYYKIYCHGPVVDVGAYAPRNYALERKVGQAVPNAWYVRQENNGWRPLARRQARAAPDEVELRATQKSMQIQFPPMRNQRRELTNSARGRRQIKWLQEVARSTKTSKSPRRRPVVSSRDRAGTADKRTSRSLRTSSLEGSEKVYLQDGLSLFDGAPHQGPRRVGTPTDHQSPVGSVAMSEAGSSERNMPMPTKVQEELDEAELLRWSEHLDFEKYLKSWHTLATSNKTEGDRET